MNMPQHRHIWQMSHYLASRWFINIRPVALPPFPSPTAPLLSLVVFPLYVCLSAPHTRHPTQPLPFSMYIFHVIHMYNTYTCQYPQIYFICTPADTSRMHTILHQKGIVTPFWRNNDVIITPSVRWDNSMCTDIMARFKFMTGAEILI